MQLLVNQTTDITSNPHAYQGGPLTFYVSGNFDGASLKIRVSPDQKSWYDVSTANGPGYFSMSNLTRCYFLAVLTSAGEGTSVTVVGG